jgi:hypothetical protein
MTTYFDRRTAVLVADELGVSYRWSELRVSFTSEYERGRKPATAKIEVYNQSPASRKWVQTRGKLVQLNAGYTGLDGVLFRGDIRRVSVQHKGVDIITSIEAGDGERAVMESTMRVTLGPGTTTLDALREISSTMGLTVGHVDLPVNPRVLLNGQTMAGPARKYLDNLAEEFGCDWWVADGQLQIVSQQSPLPGSVLLVSPDTGLVGSPSAITKERNNRTRVVGVKWTQLLRPDLRPGYLVQLDARDFRGLYVIRKIRFVGDSGYDTSYYADVEATERVLE